MDSALSSLRDDLKTMSRRAVDLILESLWIIRHSHLRGGGIPLV